MDACTLVLSLLSHFHTIQDHLLIIQMDLPLSINTTKAVCHKSVKSHISKVSLDFVKLRTFFVTWSWVEKDYSMS